jgi:DnaJ-class molecular chaperone
MKGDTFRPPDGDAIAVLGAEQAERAPHLDCFADEVVIDFPSVAPAVEKMRHAFVESGQGTAISARIDISVRQAADGVRLPLDVPLRTTCRMCGGRGETWSEPCARCDASGIELLSHQVHVSVPAGVVDGARFRFSVAFRHDPPTRVELQVAVSTQA